MRLFPIYLYIVHEYKHGSNSVTKEYMWKRKGRQIYTSTINPGFICYSAFTTASAM